MEDFQILAYNFSHIFSHSSVRRTILVWAFEQFFFIPKLTVKRLDTSGGVEMLYTTIVILKVFVTGILRVSFWCGGEPVKNLVFVLLTCRVLQKYKPLLTFYTQFLVFKLQK